METPSLATAHLRVLTSLYDAFDFFNKRFLESGDLLPTPVINLGPAGRKQAYGWFRPHSWAPVTQQPDQSGTVVADTAVSLPEINISPEYLYRKPEDVLETLLHEMAHLRNFTLGVKDCNAAQYHNKEFKKQAELFGLKVEKMHNRGWAYTALDEKGKAAIEALPFDKDVFKLSRPKAIGGAPNPYITITLRKDDWQDTLVDLLEKFDAESNSELVKRALNHLSTLTADELKSLTDNE